MHQIFAETQEEEAEALQKYMELITPLDYVITYNGGRFDIPFLQSRLQHHGLEGFTLPYNLDLYRLVNNFSDLRSRLPNLKQPTLENFMGLWQTREDEIDGGISVQLYFRYAGAYERGEELKDLRHKILPHNHDDVLQLYRLLKVIEKTDFHRAMSKYGFMVNDLVITEIGFKGGRFCVRGKQCRDCTDFVMMSNDEVPVEMCFNAAAKSFEITLPLLKKNKIIFADLYKIRNKDKVEKLPAFAENYLVLADEGKKNFEAVNMLAAQLTGLAAEICGNC